jgi:D-sedoheptulose 7-phosphate isomerase
LEREIISHIIDSKPAADNRLESLVVEQLQESARIKLAFRYEVKIIVKIANLWADAIKNGNKILFCGNGGSAADSQHLAAEFVGRFQKERGPLASSALTVDSSILTAVANDYGFDQLFARQVSAMANPGDVLVGLTTSGESANVLQAFREAKRINATTVAFTGSVGSAKDIADYAISIPSKETPRIQEAHITVGHIICGLVDEIIS